MGKKRKGTVVKRGVLSVPSGSNYVIEILSNGVIREKKGTYVPVKRPNQYRR
jgi:hypothetical protein